MAANDNVGVRITFEPETDVAYIYLDQTGDGDIAETVSYDDAPELLHGDVNLDLDKDGRLRGIEIVGASKILPESILRQVV